MRSLGFGMTDRLRTVSVSEETFVISCKSDDSTYSAGISLGEAEKSLHETTRSVGSVCL